MGREVLNNTSIYTEVDTVGNRIVPSTYSVAINALPRDEDIHLHRDKAIGSGDNFEVLVTTQIDSGGDGTTTGIADTCFMSSVIDSFDVLRDAGGDFLCIGTNTGSVLGGSELTFLIFECVSGSALNDAWLVTATLGTPYYWKFRYVKSVGTYGTLYGYIYTDEARVAGLVKTLALTLRAAFSFTKFMAVNSFNDSDTRDITGDFSDIDFQESPRTLMMMGI